MLGEAAGIRGVVCLGPFDLLSVRLTRRSRNELAEAVRRASALAYVDSITRLPNRHRMLEVLERVPASRTADAIVTFAFIGLDNFKDVNDAHGHRGGTRAGGPGALQRCTRSTCTPSMSQRQRRSAAPRSNSSNQALRRSKAATTSGAWDVRGPVLTAAGE
jgi:Diguanylate cyclase, GGDEF domain